MPSNKAAINQNGFSEITSPQLRIHGIWAYLYCAGVLYAHYFHVTGDKLMNPIVGFYILYRLIRIPYYRWDDHPQLGSLDLGTYKFIINPYVQV